MRSVSSLGISVVVAALASGCVGAVGHGPSGSSGTGGTVVTGGGGSGGGPPMTIGPLVPGRAPLRRLTRAEYDSTVNTLLGDTSHQAAQFEADLLAAGFTNNADTQNVDTTLAGQYLTAAEALASAATRDLNKLLGCDPVAAE